MLGERKNGTRQFGAAAKTARGIEAALAKNVIGCQIAVKAG
jgi:hypothetical protein